MTNIHYTQITLLCEDRQQEVFARHFLYHYFDLTARQLRVIPFPQGKGSGEQHVREQFRREVIAYRRFKNQKHIALIVIVDADTLDQDKRLQQLKAQLLEHKVDAIQDEEAIAIFIPKRNIETWIYALRGEDVDEIVAKPHFSEESNCKPEVKQLAENCRNNRPLADNAPPSLKSAGETLQRIPRKA